MRRSPEAVVSPSTIPGMAWVRRGRSRPIQQLRAVSLLIVGLWLWPIFAFVMLIRFVERSLVEPPVQLKGIARLTIRLLAYGLPLTVPLAVGQNPGRVMLNLVLAGILSPLLVLVLCQPRRLEQHIVGLVMWFWLIAYSLPVWFLD